MRRSDGFFKQQDYGRGPNNNGGGSSSGVNSLLML